MLKEGNDKSVEFTLYLDSRSKDRGNDRRGKGLDSRFRGNDRGGVNGRKGAGATTADNRSIKYF